MKLRYWDKDANEMITDENIIFWNSNYFVKKPKTLINRILKGFRGVTGHNIRSNYVMKSIGIKDKLSNTVFEKDIVELTIERYRKKQEIKGQVTIKNGIPTIVDEQGKNYTFVILENGEIKLFNEGKTFSFELKVIGNIFNK